MGAAYVVDVYRRSEVEGLVDQLHHALDARVVSEQAKGNPMATASARGRPNGG